MADRATVTFGFATAFLFPPVGLLVGLTQINKKGNDGILIITTSIAASFFWALALISVLNREPDPYGPSINNNGVCDFDRELQRDEWHEDDDCLP